MDRRLRWMRRRLCSRCLWRSHRRARTRPDTARRRPSCRRQDRWLPPGKTQTGPSPKKFCPKGRSGAPVVVHAPALCRRAGIRPPRPPHHAGACRPHAAELRLARSVDLMAGFRPRPAPTPSRAVFVLGPHSWLGTETTPRRPTRADHCPAVDPDHHAGVAGEGPRRRAPENGRCRGEGRRRSLARGPGQSPEADW